MIELVGVGHCCQDFLCVIEDYPPEDGTTRINSIEKQGGGAVATAIVAASRLGIRTALIGNLGNDHVGDDIVAELQREGVDTSAMDRLQGVNSLSSYVMIQTERGTRTKFPMRDNLPPIRWDERQIRMLKQAAILHLDGTHYENARNAAELAKKLGILISLDGCTRQKDNLLNRELASMADILITNAAYPASVTGNANLRESLLEMSGWGPKIVMATFGAQGVFAVIDGEVRHFPAYPADVIDTTGAGDVFHGGFLAAFSRGKNLEHCIRFAAYTAARKCERIGGRQGIPDWDTVESGYMSGLD